MNIYFSFVAIGSECSDLKREVKRQRVVTLLRSIPHDRILIETDSPDQIPESIQKMENEYGELSCNEISMIRFTCDDISRNLTTLSIHAVAELTTANACRAFLVEDQEKDG